MTNYELLILSSLVGLKQLIEENALIDLLDKDGSNLKNYFDSKEMAEQMLAETLGWGE